MERAMNRRILSQAWSNIGVGGGQPRVIGPFRYNNNAGDYLSRTNSVTGGSNQVTSVRGGMVGYKSRAGHVQINDQSAIQSATCNTKFVYDGSDYTKYKKLRAMQSNYRNDVTAKKLNIHVSS